MCPVCFCCLGVIYRQQHSNDVNERVLQKLEGPFLIRCQRLIKVGWERRLDAGDLVEANHVAQGNVDHLLAEGRLSGLGLNA